MTAVLDEALRAHEKVMLMKALTVARRFPKTDLLGEGCGPWGWRCGCGREHKEDRDQRKGLAGHGVQITRARWED